MTQLQKWKSLAQIWQDQGPPATPSFDDVDNFADALTRHGDGNISAIGVLGCTPALRNRMHDDFPDARISVIDFCQEMYAATSAAVRDDVKDNEQYFAVDWLEMRRALPLEVDAFIGDKSLDNVNIEDWEKFFDSAAACLQPGGLLVLHVGFPDPRLAAKPFEHLAQRWVDYLTLKNGDIGDAASGLWEDLLSGSAHHVTKYLSLDPYRAALERHSNSDTALGTLAARVLTDFASQLNARWTNFDRSDLVQAAKRSDFGLLEERYSHDYEAAPNQPTMTFRSVRR